MKLPVIHAVIALVSHLVLLVILVLAGNLDIFAIMISYVFFALLMCVLNGLAIRKHLRYKQEIKRTFLVPGIASAIMGIAAWLMYEFLHELIGYTITLCICLPMAVIIYAFFILLMQGITEQELAAFPKGRTLVRICKKLLLM